MTSLNSAGDKNKHNNEDGLAGFNPSGDKQVGDDEEDSTEGQNFVGFCLSEVMEENKKKVKAKLLLQFAKLVVGMILLGLMAKTVKKIFTKWSVLSTLPITQLLI